ncbi:MAG: hypothetical protein EZS28_043162 [Streblomastix strix]|uniref:RNase H type-1 domain-containing protein n=1 Tax=Streblomastix strix TaxID=222440 RepID=A0A5J4TTU4_9EUKA|nr:MAG: hypothetical protein EZS28_043162 [Streblomastix strix]
MIVKMPLDRQIKLMYQIHLLIQQTKSRQFVQIRMLAKLIGKLQFLKFQFQLASFHLIKLNRLKDRAVRKRGWDAILQLKPTILSELFWWHSTIFKNTPLQLQMKTRQIATLTTDASRTGWGAVLNLNQQEWLQASTWKKPMRLRSSNQREARAILYALRKFKQQLLTVDQLTIQTDNQVAVMNLKRKASAAPLATTMKKICQEAMQQRLIIHPVHI